MSFKWFRANRVNGVRALSGMLMTAVWVGSAGAQLLANQTPDAAPASAGQPTAPIIVLNSRDADLSLIDPRQLTTIERVPTGKEPHHLYPSPDGRFVILANAAGNDLLLIDPVSGMPVRRVSGIADPYHLGISPDQQWLVVASNRLNHVDIYRYSDILDPNARPNPVKRLAAPRVPSHLVFSADSAFAFVTLQESNELAAIDLASLEIAWTLPLGKQPAGIAITPDGRLLLIGIMGEDYIDVIDWRARQSVKQIKTGAGAHAFRAVGDRKRILVSNRIANTISIVDMDSLTVLGQIKAPGGPDCIEVSADGKTGYTTARWARRLHVFDIDARKLIHSVEVGASPHGVFIYPRAASL